jgi:hypothetical protein
MRVTGRSSYHAVRMCGVLLYIACIRLCDLKPTLDREEPEDRTAVGHDVRAKRLRS